MDNFFKKCILYKSKFSLMSEYLGTNGVLVKRLHCTHLHMHKNVFISPFVNGLTYVLCITDLIIFLRAVIILARHIHLG